MTDLDRERERIGRALENGYMTATEHRRITRAIDAEQRRRDRAEAETRRMLAEAEARRAVKDKMRRDFQKSLKAEARDGL